MNMDLSKLHIESGRWTSYRWSCLFDCWRRRRFYISQATVNVDDDNKITDNIVAGRYRGENVLVSPDKVDYIDVSPQQVVSVTTSLIPFLEHDDATRALMGANMQRQALPLLKTEAPFVGTGAEYIAARDSGSVVVAKADGIVSYADAKNCC